MDSSDKRVFVFSLSVFETEKGAIYQYNSTFVINGDQTFKEIRHPSSKSYFLASSSFKILKKGMK